MPSKITAASASIVAGALFVVEALLSPFHLVNSEIQYHGPNSILNLASAAAALGIYRFAKNEIGRSGRVGSRLLIFAAGITGVGGLVPFLTVLFGGKAPGLVEGIVHTTVLLAILAMIPFAVGLRKLSSGPGLLMMIASIALVALVIIGFDDPWIFLGPEALLGAAWWWTGSALRRPIAASGAGESRRPEAGQIAARSAS